MNSQEPGDKKRNESESLLNMRPVLTTKEQPKENALH